MVLLRAESRKGGFDMWTVIYMAQTKESVLTVKELLDVSGVPVRVRPVGEGGAENAVRNAEENGYYEILVPETEAQMAHSILIENGY